MNRRITTFALALSLCAIGASAQLNLPRVSQKAAVDQTFGITNVKISYCRPGVKGRVIWGGLVPYDQVWRTGANEATTIAFSTDVKVNGQPLTAGTYGLFTIPGKESWTVIFNNNPEQWGSFNYDQKKDVLRITVKPEAIPMTEWMTFGFPQVSNDSAVVALDWEKLRVPFSVTAETTKMVMADAKTAVAASKADDWRTPLRAANYAFDNGDVRQAADWVAKSIERSGTYGNLALQAKIEAKNGDTKAAIATAERAIAAAKASKDKVDASEMEKLLAELKGSKK